MTCIPPSSKQSRTTTSVCRRSKSQISRQVSSTHKLESKRQFLQLVPTQRVALKFPFVDRLNDGASAFKYTPPQLVSAENLIAFLGSTIYGDTVAGSFEPSCDAYASNGPNETYMRAYALVEFLLPNARPVADMSFRTAARIPYTIDTFVNVLNQPLFGDGIPLCDNYITLFNTTVTTGEYAPVPVEGTLAVRPPLYPNDEMFEYVYGFQMANAFVERNGVVCGSLKGYSGR
ncbi:hypothetical protein PMIN06_002513 [Paraphaeosphaeria minitans]